MLFRACNAKWYIVDGEVIRIGCHDDYVSGGKSSHYKARDDHGM